MRALRLAYRLLNLLSIDIAAGAVLSALFFADFMGVSILPYGLIALGLTVWIIYTADHLRDARRIGSGASSARHRFHHKYFKTLSVVMVFCAGIVGWMIVFMREKVLAGGILLVFFVIVYLVGHRFLRWTKEIMVAVLYTCGVLLPSVAVHGVKLALSDYFTFCCFAVIALINLLTLSWFDFASDSRDQQLSFATLLGKSITGRMVYMLSLLNITALIALSFFSRDPYAMLTLVVMNVTLLMVFLFPKVMESNDRYRLVGDMVFLFPGIYLVWPGG